MCKSIKTITGLIQILAEPQNVPVLVSGLSYPAIDSLGKAGIQMPFFSISENLALSTSNYQSK